VVSRQSGKAAESRSQVPAGANLSRLPFSAELDEAALLISPSKRRILRGFNATPARLRQSRLEDFAVLHFSTHALIDDRVPELSRIALSMVDSSGRTADGFLRPYQLSAFHLDGSTVVLSACDTALGKEVSGEGLAGFTASLTHAGAAQIVMTLADVDAEGSSEFLKETYSHYFSPGDIPMEHAMTLSRRSLVRSARWSDPYYWASMVLYGRPAGTL
jgi:CHAT domain-containing protein